MQRICHHHSIQIAQAERPRKVGNDGPDLRDRYRRHDPGSQLGESDSIAINGMDDAGGTDQIGKREREGSRSRAEIRPLAALALLEPASE